MKKKNWKTKKVLVTGGASFIGSHLVDHLVELGADVRVVDNLSSGKKENLSNLIRNHRIEFIQEDLLDAHASEKFIKGIDVVFHLAAIHGGRGYLELHQSDFFDNALIDINIIKSALKEGVSNFIFSSSACVYPTQLQTKNHHLPLKEDMVGPPYSPDGIYGWEKLHTELALKQYFQQFKFPSAICRYFSVYGDRGLENHSLVALTAKTFIRQNPFEVWGDGHQVRNWTHVSDIVRGTISAAERIFDSTAVNLGSPQGISVNNAIKEIFANVGFFPQIKYFTSKPIGVYSRIADITLAKNLLGWKPLIPFKEGVKKMINWYFQTKNPKNIKSELSKLLTER